MTTAHRPTWAAAQAAASDVGNWSTGGELSVPIGPQVNLDVPTDTIQL